MSWYSSTVLGVSVRDSARLVQPVKVVAFCCLRGMLQYQREFAYCQHVSSGEHYLICHDKLLRLFNSSYIYISPVGIPSSLILVSYIPLLDEKIRDE